MTQQFTLTIQSGKNRFREQEGFDSIEIKPGDTLAIVGPTGSGKSAFINDIETPVSYTHLDVYKRQQYVCIYNILIHKCEDLSVMVIMETPCQKAVWDLVPAIRASLAIELVNKGQSQATSAKLLGIAPSAVSQYIMGKRGYRICLLYTSRCV